MRKLRIPPPCLFQETPFHIAAMRDGGPSHLHAASSLAVATGIIKDKGAATSAPAVTMPRMNGGAQSAPMAPTRSWSRQV